MPELPPTTPGRTSEPDRTGPFGTSSPAFLTPDDIQPGIIIVGKYKLLEPIGEGGMGAVWMAQQIEPVKRLVAVKLIKAGMDSKTVVARFEAERQALSMMDHPNIARVFDVGATPHGRPFFVMELVKGTPITEFCDQRKLTPKQRLELFVPVCLAIQHAHQKGIIHRDIKPSNALVALHDDKPVPKVIDFGVAKATGTPLTEKTLHTAFDNVVGTPAYMSPEQATFNQLDIDTRSDVYSLGVLLYELLTGTTPIERERFRQAALLEMLRVVREEEPPRPSARLSSTQTKGTISEKRGTEPARLTREFRGELDWIAMKALEKDRSRRYETASGFAADVQRYLCGEPVLAHPPSASYRLRKFVRRHRALVAAAAAIVLGLIGGAAGAVYGVIKADGERTANGLRLEAEAARDGERDARGAAERSLVNEQRAAAELAHLGYSHSLELAHREHRENRIVPARQLLDSCPESLRGWEWRHVHRMCHSELAVLAGHSGMVWSAAFSTDGTRILSAGGDATVRIRDAATGEALLQRVGHSARIFSARYSPDGSRFLTASEDGTARVWDARTGDVVAVMKGHSHRVVAAEYSTDGRHAVTVCMDHTARVWDAASGREITRLENGGVEVRAACFLSGSTAVATGWDDGTIRLFSLEGKPSRILRGHPGAVMTLIRSRDGDRLLSGASDGSAKVWDVRTGRVVAAMTCQFRNPVAALTGTGDRAATVTGPETIVVRDVDGGAERSVLRLPPTTINSITFSPDGNRLIATADDGIARMWDVASGRLLLQMKGHELAVMSAAFSADGGRIATASVDGTVRVWSTDLDVDTVFASEVAPIAASFSPDGTRLALAYSTRQAHLLDLTGGRDPVRIHGFDTEYFRAAFSRDGRFVATADHCCGRTWEAATGKPLREFKGHAGRLHCAEFSPDGAKLATGSIDLTGRVWDAATGRELSILRGHSGEVVSAKFSSDGSRVVTASEDGTARTWEASTGRPLVEFRGHKAWVWAAVYSPDDRLVLTSSNDGTARIWDAGTGKQLHILRGHNSAIAHAIFSPDGRRAVTFGEDATIRIWDVDRGAALLTLADQGGAPLGGAFDPDGTKLATAWSLGRSQGAAKGVRLLTLDTAAPATRLRKATTAPPPRDRPRS